MNGDWDAVSWRSRGLQTDVSRRRPVMHRLAPNVAMVWCPNDIPEDRIANYYPGKESVDWVGLNFYSVLFNDGDRARAADWRNPADSLRYIYATYSKQHPIMIGEWAATHRSVVDNTDRPDFAIDKIAQLYGALPRLFPRVKAVHWLSLNTIDQCHCQAVSSTTSPFSPMPLSRRNTRRWSPPTISDPCLPSKPGLLPGRIRASRWGDDPLRKAEAERRRQDV